MKKIFISGAMSADNMLNVCNNIHDGIVLGNKLIEKGYAPFVPHLDILIKIANGVDLSIPMQHYYDYTMEWLKVSDAVLVCPNYKNSIGALAEIKQAEELYKPIYYDINVLHLCETIKDNRYKRIDVAQKELQKEFPELKLFVDAEKGVIAKYNNMEILTKDLK